MLRPYGRLLLIQVLLALGGTGGTFVAFFYLEAGATVPFVLQLLGGFAAAALGTAAMARMRSVPSHLAMVAGILLYAAQFPFLLALPRWWSPVAVSVGWGLSIPLFFLPLNTLVAELTGAGDRAVKLGGLFLAFTTVGIATPSLGGYLIALGGYPLCFAFSLVVLAVDVALLLSLRGDSRPLRFALGIRHLGRTAAASLSQGGMEGATAIAIPTAIFSFVEEEATIGLVLSAFALFGGMATVLLGRLSDRARHRRRFLVAGSLFAAAGLAGVVMAADLAQYVVASSLMQLAYTTGPLFLFAIAVDRFEGRRADGIATREVLLNSGRVVGVALAGALFLSGFPPLAGFGLAAAFALGMAAG